MRAVATALFLGLVVAATGASAKIRPVVLLHGLMANYEAMSHIKGWLEQDFPGIYIHNADIPHQRNKNGKLDSLIYSMESQVDILGGQLQADGNLTDGFDLVCHSQGGLTCRAYIEKYGGSKVHNFVSLAGPQQGVYGVPDFNALCPDYECPWLAKLVSQWAETGWTEPLFQQYLTVGQYWKNPLDYPLYLNTSAYLPDINNERSVKNPLYKENMIAMTGNLTLVMATEDHIVVPKESALFDFFTVGQDKNITDMTETDGYKGDWIGLKTLNEGGRLERVAVNCTHLGLVRPQCKSNVYDAVVRPRVGGLLP